MKQLGMLVLIGYTLSGGVAHAATYYVSKAGSNNNSCAQAQSLATSRLTVAAGIGCLSAGDTLLVRAGNYDEVIGSTPSGTSWNSKVRIANYQGEVVWLAPSSGGIVVLLNNSEHYVEFDGINMDGRRTTGPDVIFMPTPGLSNHIRFQNAEIIGGPLSGSCANVCGGTDSEFINLVIHGGGVGGGCGYACGNAGWYSGGANNLVEHCEIYDTSSEGLQIYNSGGPTLSNNNIIRNNRIHDVVRSGDNNPGARIVGIIVAGGSNNLVYNNVVYNIGRADGTSSNAGITVYGSATAGTKIWNNTVYATYNYGITVENAVPNTAVQNNIVYGSLGGAFSDNGSGTIHDHNLEGPNPLVLNSAAGDFRLQAGSPAIDAGVVLATVNTDLTGAVRPQGSAPDIGAYEFVAGGQATSPAAPSGLRIVSY